MANKLADARRSLVRAQESAKKRLEDLEDERREIKASLKSVDAALKALEKSSCRRATSQPTVAPDESHDESITDGS